MLSCVLEKVIKIKLSVEERDFSVEFFAFRYYEREGGEGYRNFRIMQ